MSKARCYIEFCCNEAVHHVRDHGQDGAWKGRWGWCGQHQHLALDGLKDAS